MFALYHACTGGSQPASRPTLIIVPEFGRRPVHNVKLCGLAWGLSVALAGHFGNKTFHMYICDYGTLLIITDERLKINKGSE